MTREPLLQLLRTHQPWDDTETQHCAATLEFLERQAQFWQRGTLEGHVTASAWIVDYDFTHALLVHHRKLNRWFQPGGHIEDDADIATAVQREAQEECGVATLIRNHDALFDVDVHLIPANSKEAAHWHYDIRLLLISDRAAPVTVSVESKDVRWFPLHELTQPTIDASIRRMVHKMELIRRAPVVV